MSELRNYSLNLIINNAFNQYYVLIYVQILLIYNSKISYLVEASIYETHTIFLIR